MADLALLGKLTILIPTYKRQSFLRRQIEFWAQTDATVEILDGSPDPACYIDADTLPDNVSYHHLPVGIEERLKFACRLIRTDYAVLLSDDEFFIPSALASCILAMESNDDIVSCKGTAIAFNYYENNVSGRPIYPGLKGYRIDQQSPEERIRAHLSHYEMATLWAVMRSRVFILTVSAITSAGPFGSAGVTELQISLVAAWCGKCIVIDELMWLRSLENRNIWSRGKKDVVAWFRDSSNQHEIKQAIGAVADAVSNVFRHKNSGVHKAIEKAFHEYVIAQERKLASQKRIIHMARRIIAKSIRMIISATITLNHSVFRPKRGTGSLLECAELAASAGQTVNFEQLSFANSIILDFYQKQ